MGSGKAERSALWVTVQGVDTLEEDMRAMSVMGLLSVAGLSVAITACGDSKTQRVGREFSSMQECLDYIAMDTVDSLKILSDEPGDVSGRTERQRLYFRCEAKATGSRGLVLEGRWDRPKL